MFPQPERSRSVGEGFRWFWLWLHIDGDRIVPAQASLAPVDGPSDAIGHRVELVACLALEAGAWCPRHAHHAQPRE